MMTLHRTVVFAVCLLGCGEQASGPVPEPSKLPAGKADLLQSGLAAVPLFDDMLAHVVRLADTTADRFGTRRFQMWIRNRDCDARGCGPFVEPALYRTGTITLERFGVPVIDLDI